MNLWTSSRNAWDIPHLSVYRVASSKFTDPGKRRPAKQSYRTQPPTKNASRPLLWFVGGIRCFNQVLGIRRDPTHRHHDNDFNDLWGFPARKLGGTPKLAGWLFCEGKKPIVRNGWWLGVPPWLRKPPHMDVSENCVYPHRRMRDVLQAKWWSTSGFRHVQTNSPKTSGSLKYLDLSRDTTPHNWS